MGYRAILQPSEFSAKDYPTAQKKEWRKISTLNSCLRTKISSVQESRLQQERRPVASLQPAR